ncbi:hypothetical protein LTR85_002580 [Meristemomyces frigidus]|nr:hypothetical protein LTR85_002580 [Meristemomyces frigidus]
MSTSQVKERKGVATPQLRALMQSAITLKGNQEDDGKIIDDALAASLFPLAEMRDMAYEGLKTLKTVQADQATVVERMESRGLTPPPRKYPMSSLLFMTTKDGLQKFELWEAKSYLIDILGEIREIKEEDRVMKEAIDKSVRDEIVAAARRQAAKK